MLQGRAIFPPCNDYFVFPCLLLSKDGVFRALPFFFFPWLFFFRMKAIGLRVPPPNHLARARFFPLKNPHYFFPCSRGSNFLTPAAHSRQLIFGRLLYFLLARPPPYLFPPRVRLFLTPVLPTPRRGAVNSPFFPPNREFGVFRIYPVPATCLARSLFSPRGSLGLTHGLAPPPLFPFTLTPTSVWASGSGFCVPQFFLQYARFGSLSMDFRQCGFPLPP